MSKTNIVFLTGPAPGWAQEISDDLARKASGSMRVKESDTDRERRQRFIDLHIGLGQSLVPTRASSSTEPLLPTSGSIVACVGF